jgi:hypothetical protein
MGVLQEQNTQDCMHVGSALLLAVIVFYTMIDSGCAPQLVTHLLQPNHAPF